MALNTLSIFKLSLFLPLSCHFQTKCSHDDVMRFKLWYVDETELAMNRQHNNHICRRKKY